MDFFIVGSIRSLRDKGNNWHLILKWMQKQKITKKIKRQNHLRRNKNNKKSKKWVESMFLSNVKV